MLVLGVVLLEPAEREELPEPPEFDDEEPLPDDFSSLRLSSPRFSSLRCSSSRREPLLRQSREPRSPNRP
jgi:hypothetical protein